MSGGYTVVAGAGAAAGGGGSQGTPGVAGQNGTNGATINYGNGPPASNVGVVNDSYIDLTNYMYYPMKTTSGWTINPFAMVGPKGTTGNAGTNGTNGSAGTNGTNGTNGATIIYGSGAPASGTGNVNDNYIDGTAKQFYPAKTASGWTNAAFNIVGSQGIQGNAGSAGTNGTNGTNGSPGANGTKIYSGSGAPSSATGVLGDYYVDTTGYNFWGPKNSDGWTSLPFTMQGPQGTAGTPAPQNCPGLYVLSGVANWAAATTNIATLPSSLTYGVSLVAATVYAASGTQPSTMSLGFGSSVILSGRSVSGLTSAQFTTFTPSGIGTMGTSGQSIVITTGGGALSGGGTARVDCLLFVH